MSLFVIVGVLLVKVKVFGLYKAKKQDLPYNIYLLQGMKLQLLVDQ